MCGFTIKALVISLLEAIYADFNRVELVSIFRQKVINFRSREASVRSAKSITFLSHKSTDLSGNSGGMNLTPKVLQLSGKFPENGGRKSTTVNQTKHPYEWGQ